MLQDADEFVMAVGKRVRLDDDSLSGRALDGKTARFDFRRIRRPIFPLDPDLEYEPE